MLLVLLVSQPLARTKWVCVCALCVVTGWRMELEFPTEVHVLPEKGHIRDIDASRNFKVSMERTGMGKGT